MSHRSSQHDPSAESLLQATLSRNLRAARKRKGLTQAEVAKAIGVSTTIFWRYEGARMWPSIETLRDMCKVLDISADVLLGLGQEETPAILPVPPDDPPMVRRLLGKLRQASRATQYLVEVVLAAIEKRRGGQP